MYSQCPECLTRFRVTAAALRAAHGTVRCGRCGSAFDALPRLSDTIQEIAPAGPADPSMLALSGAAGSTVATAAGLVSASEGNSVAEFHFSADDIENVFLDAREWQSRFGSFASPGDRAGKFGDTSAAELDALLNDDGLVAMGDGETAEAPDDPSVWVHEPESIEDITLEGERIQIEGFAGFEEDFLEREIEKEIDEQHRAESTGSQRRLDPVAELYASDDALDAAISADAVVIEGLEPLHDLDSTDQFERLRDVPGSVYPDDEAAAGDDPAATHPHRDLGDSVPTPAMPAAVAAAAAGFAARPAPWRRFPEPTPEDVLEHEHDPQLVGDLSSAASERRTAWAWGAGAFLLALMLFAQLVHHYRLQLVRDASVGPALRDVYSRLGLPLPQAWDLASFELRQWGASDAAPNPAGTMSVRVSIRNGAAFAQPLPLLRLELEDRFGGTVARRDFEPGEYLKDSAQAGRLLAKGAATEADLVLASATTEAVGYRLNVCMRAESGTVHCAQDGDPTAESATAAR